MKILDVYNNLHYYDGDISHYNSTLFFDNVLAIIEDKNKYAFIRKDGTYLFNDLYTVTNNPFRFSSAQAFRNGYSLVHDGNYSFLGNDGKFLTIGDRYSFEFAMDFHENFAIVVFDRVFHTYDYITSMGKCVYIDAIFYKNFSKNFRITELHNVEKDIGCLKYHDADSGEDHFLYFDVAFLNNNILLVSEIPCSRYVLKKLFRRGI